MGASQGPQVSAQTGALPTKLNLIIKTTSVHLPYKYTFPLQNGIWNNNTSKS